MGPSWVYRSATLCGLCVYVYIWCSACLCQCDLVVSVSKKAALGGGVVAHTLHKASLLRLPSKYTTEHYVEEPTNTWNVKSKPANLTVIYFYRLHSHNVNKTLILSCQQLNIWNSSSVGVFIAESSSCVVDVSRTAKWRCFLDPLLPAAE